MSFWQQKLLYLKEELISHDMSFDVQQCVLERLFITTPSENNFPCVWFKAIKL